MEEDYDIFSEFLYKNVRVSETEKKFPNSWNGQIWNRYIEKVVGLIKKTTDCQYPGS